MDSQLVVGVLMPSRLSPSLLGKPLASSLLGQGGWEESAFLAPLLCWDLARGFPSRGRDPIVGCSPNFLPLKSSKEFVGRSEHQVVVSDPCRPQAAKSM